MWHHASRVGPGEAAERVQILRRCFTCAALVLATCVTAACPRLLWPSQEAPKAELAALCQNSEQCLTGFCQDGVCCAATCTRTESCNLPRSVGSCTSRQLGDGCASNEQCSNGHCVDGVCCDQACEAHCSSCANAGAAGHCGLAADNTDPRGDCSGALCTACFGGFCAPSLVGSDPAHACAAGQACSGSGTCATGLGGSCSPDECAAGFCAGGRCMAYQLTAVEPDLLVPDAVNTRLLGLAVTPDGTPAMLLRQLALGVNTQGMEVVTKNTYLVRRQAGQWNGTLLLQADRCAADITDAELGGGPYRRMALVAVGSSMVALVFQGFQECQNAPEPYGINAYWVGPDMAVGRTDRLLVNTTAGSPFDVVHLDAAFDGQDRVLVVVGLHNGSSYPVQLLSYSVSSGTWTAPLIVSTGVYQWGPALMVDGAVTVFLARTSTQVNAVEVTDDGTITEVASVTLPAGCNLYGYIPLTGTRITSPEGGQKVVLTGLCRDQGGPTSFEPLVLQYQRGGGFESPIWDRGAAGLASGWHLPVALSPTGWGTMTFSSVGRVAIMQRDDDARWRSEFVSPLVLWSERQPLHSRMAATGPGHTAVLAWTQDRFDTQRPALFDTTLSRVFLLESTVTPK